MITMISSASSDEADHLVAADHRRAIVLAVGKRRADRLGRNDAHAMALTSIGMDRKRSNPWRGRKVPRSARRHDDRRVERTCARLASGTAIRRSHRSRRSQVERFGLQLAFSPQKHRCDAPSGGLIMTRLRFSDERHSGRASAAVRCGAGIVDDAVHRQRERPDAGLCLDLERAGFVRQTTTRRCRRRAPIEDAAGAVRGRALPAHRRQLSDPRSAGHGDRRYLQHLSVLRARPEPRDPLRRRRRPRRLHLVGRADDHAARPNGRTGIRRRR